MPTDIKSVWFAEMDASGKVNASEYRVSGGGAETIRLSGFHTNVRVDEHLNRGVPRWLGWPGRTKVEALQRLIDALALARENHAESVRHCERGMDQARTMIATEGAKP